MNASSGDAHGAASLRDYLNVVRRRKWIILQAVILVPLAAVLYSLQQTPVYESSATVLLSRQDLSDQLNNIQSQTANSNTLVPTQAEVARVPEIFERTIAQAGLRTMTAEQFAAESSVGQSANADTLRLTVRNTDPKLATTL